jgi:cell division protein FtsB
VESFEDLQVIEQAKWERQQKEIERLRAENHLLKQEKRKLKQQRRTKEDLWDRVKIGKLLDLHLSRCSTDAMLSRAKS